MGKKIAVIAGLLVAGLVMVLLLALLVPGFMDWNRHRGRIASMATDAVGRKVSIEGDLRLSLFPDIVF